LTRLREFWFGQIDVAPVSAFRILFGLQLFNWVWQLYPNIPAFFTDEGILPRRDVLLEYSERFTILGMLSKTWQVELFWLVSLVVAVLLTVGWRSRLMAFLGFIVVSSFSWRDPLILDGSDFVFRVVPLWLAFTDCGGRYSLDAMARRERGEATGRGFALPVRILELQIAWIYLATGIEKMAGTNWPGGLATWYSLQLEHTFGRSWAYPIATNLTLVSITTYWTLLVEHAFLPLAMLPSRITRLIAVLIGASLHLGILALMNVGNFPVIMLSALVLYLPPEWIDRVVMRIDRTFRARMRPPVLAYADGVAQSVARQLPAPMRIPAASSRVERFAFSVALSALALAAFITAVPRQFESLRPTGELGSLLRFLSVDQRWDMFSPEPARSDGWMTMPATLTDGSTLDLLTGGPIDNSSQRYSDPLYSRWAKVQERIASTAYSDYRQEYARQFCRMRNLHLGPGQVPIKTFDVHYVERVIQPPGEGPPTFRDILIWSHRC
jgi:hypothetical protein